MITYIEAQSAKPKDKIYLITDGDGLYLRGYPNKRFLVHDCALSYSFKLSYHNHALVVV